MPMFDAPKTSGKLLTMLQNPQLTPQQLFSVPDIVGDIKQKVQTFLAFCLKRRQFTLRMFSIALNSQYAQLQEYSHQKIAQLASEVLASDENATSDFLFGPENTLNNQSEISEKFEGQDSNIESEAEKLFCDDEPPKVKQLDWFKEPDAFEKYELVKLSLTHLKSENKNETCLGYINKIYASLLRKECCQFMDFLEQNTEYLDLLIQNIDHSSIANLVSLVLACEDRTRQYKFQAFKRQIFSKLLGFSEKNIGNQLYFGGFLSTIQEIFNTTKQSYYQYFEDFKRCANVLVQEKTLLKFAQFLNSETEIVFSNACSYLETVIKRINAEGDEQDYYRQSQNTEPSMNFQHSCLLEKFQQLLKFIPKASKYAPMTHLSFINFLLQILKNIKSKEAPFDNIAVFKALMDFFFAERSKGMIKNYYFQLLKLILKRMTKTELEVLAEWMIQNEYHKEFLGDTDNIEANKNSISCFGYSLCFEIQERQQIFLNRLKTERDITLNRTFQKFNTRLADYGKKSEPNQSNKDEQFQLNFQIPTKKASKGENTQRSSQTQVGKNQISIPTLQLPIKNQNNNKVTVEEEEVERLFIPEMNSRELLIHDLKNTKIQLPMKFRSKKSMEEAKEPSPAKEGTPVEELKTIEIEKVAPSEETKKILKKEQLIQGSKSSQATIEVNQKFFVKHLLIF